MIISQSKIFEFIKLYRWIILILIIFLLLRLPGISLPYYQDEWKNVASASTIQSAGSFFAHPPLMQMWFVAGYALFGDNQFRVFPLLFSAMTLILLYIVARKRFGNTTALWVSVLFTISFYSVWGSLMTDVDGSAMPLLFLLSVYCYDRFSALDEHSKKKWFLLLVLSCLAGFLIKLSFILVVGALAIDYIWNNWSIMTFKKWSILAGSLFGFGIVYIVALYIIQAIYPAFSIDFMLSHANNFVSETGRDYIQIIVQGVKAIYYLSPLLIVPLLFSSKEIFKQTRLFFIYLLLGFLFYFIVFDFSRGVLDKYLMFTIVPLAVISGAIVARIFKSREFNWRKMKWPIVCAAIIAIIIFKLNFFPHGVMSLYPKTEWFSRVLYGEWNFLNPFNGGSGPIGFYVSFLFVAVSFIVSALFGIVGLFKREWKYICVIFILIISIAYNAVLAEELMFGKINGSSAEVLNASVSFIANNPSIKQIMSYNDIGNHEISKIGKWKSRFYAAPQFETNHRQIFSDFKGQYLVVDIPHISEDIFYGKFFAKCNILFETVSGKITGRVYDCPNSKAIIDSI
ncbi:MAG: glycosyltransferase family 39 protein [Patescibacteria group bacterium]